MTRENTVNEMQCPKCGAHSGDDWEQCKGACPVPGSPHFQQSSAMLSAVPLHEGDDWSELERLARAATPGQWYAPDPDDNPSAVKSCLGHRAVYVADATEPEDQAFIAAANPATILKLIASARAAPPPPSAPRMLVDQSWLDRRVENEPDGLDCEVVPPSVEVFGSSAEGADTHRVAATAVLDWKEAATGLCAEVLKQAPVQIEKISDLLYEGLLNDVQAYLRENVDYNLSSELRRAKSDATRANNALQSVAIILGVDTHGFPNYPTPEMVEDQCSIALAKLEAKATAVSTAERVGTSEASEPKPSVEVERLREALEELVDFADQCVARLDRHDAGMLGDDPINAARAALSRKQEPGVPTPGGEG